MLLIDNTDHAYYLFWIFGLFELKTLVFMLFPIVDTSMYEPVLFSIMVDGQPSRQCTYELRLLL